MLDNAIGHVVVERVEVVVLHHLGEKAPHGGLAPLGGNSTVGSKVAEHLVGGFLGGGAALLDYIPVLDDATVLLSAENVRGDPLRRAVVEVLVHVHEDVLPVLEGADHANVA